MDISNMGLEEIRQAVTFAKDGFKVAQDATGIASQLREMFSKQKKESTDPQVALLISDLAGKLIQAQLAQTQIMGRLQKAEHALEKAKQHELDAQRYQLIETPGHAFVLQYLPHGDKPVHCVCPACFENGTKMILQPRRQHENLQCGKCKVVFRMSTKD